MFVIKMRNTISDSHERARRLEKLTQCFMEKIESTEPLDGDTVLSESQSNDVNRLLDSTIKPEHIQTGVGNG